MRKLKAPHKRVRAIRRQITVALTPGVFRALTRFRKEVRFANALLYDSSLNVADRYAFLRVQFKRIEEVASILSSAFIVDYPEGERNDNPST